MLCKPRLRLWIAFFFLAMITTRASDKMLRIGIEGALEPFNLTDASAQVVGFDVEFTDAMAKAGLTGNGSGLF